MTAIVSLIIVVCSGMIGQAGIAGAQAAYSVLHSFTLPPSNPTGPLFRGSDGAFYGTTRSGGTFNSGTVFKLAPDGTGFTTLHSFAGSDGAYPNGGLVQGADGAIYGATISGGTIFQGYPSGGGTVFKLGVDGTGFTTLHSFAGSDGARPNGALIQGSDGAFYGTTISGGPSHLGTVFRLSPDGTGFTTLHVFTGPDGSVPSSLVQGADGVFYGTTSQGGALGGGTVFKVSADGTGFTTLHTFPAPPPCPVGLGAACSSYSHTSALIQGADGDFYGTTNFVSLSRGGSVFKLAPDGTGFTTLHSFGVGDLPVEGLVQGTDGALYGTTSGGGISSNEGTIFKLRVSGTRFTTLHSFTGSNGAGPSALMQGDDGALYGTTWGGGSISGYSNGTIFKIASDGAGFTTLLSFSGTEGVTPRAALVQGIDGTFYGTTELGGTFNRGIVFKLAADGTGFASLHSFTGPDGAFPCAGIVQGNDGALYGTTAGMRYVGGVLETSDRGTIFKITADGTEFATLHVFTGPGGTGYCGSLIQGSDGNLYGTTARGGTSNYGTIFKVAKDGTGFTTLHSFTGPDGAYPVGGLVQGSDGNLYGTTTQGGPNIFFYSGTIFKVSADGTGFTTLHAFTGPDGAAPRASLFRGRDGAFYGTTSAGGSSNQGTVFMLAPEGAGFTTLHSFTGLDGVSPYAGIVQGSDGRFYGTTSAGGPGDGGVVYVLQLNPLPTLTLRVNQPTLHAWQRLTLVATVTPAASFMTADVYVALTLPNGSLRFLQGDGSLTTAVHPFAVHWPVGPYNGQIFSHTFSGGEPAGSYTWLAAFTQPGTLNLIGPIVSAPFSFSP